jgi:hypothetical protein
VTGYLVAHEIRYVGDLTEKRLSKLMDALLDVETCDKAISDPDLAASLNTGDVDVQMTVEADDVAEAATKALCAIRTAIHAIGDATPGWETARGAMSIAPSEVSQRLLADA